LAAVGYRPLLTPFPHAILMRCVQKRDTRKRPAANMSDSTTREAETSALADIAPQEAVTHQLTLFVHVVQGSLISAIAALTAIKEQDLPLAARDLLHRARWIVEDALAFSFGTFTALADEAGRNTTLLQSAVDAPGALRRIVSRLQVTNAREDLRVEFLVDKHFPVLTIDRN